MLCGPNVACLQFALYTKQFSWELSLCSIFQIFLGSVFHFALFSMDIHWRFFPLSSSADTLLFIHVFSLFCSLFSCPVWSGMVSLSHQGLNLEASKVSSHQASPGNALGASDLQEVQSLKCSFSSLGLKGNSGWRRVSCPGLNSTAEGTAMESAEIRPHSWGGCVRGRHS